MLLSPSKNKKEKLSSSTGSDNSGQSGSTQSTKSGQGSGILKKIWSRLSPPKYINTPQINDIFLTHCRSTAKDETDMPENRSGLREDRDSFGP